MRHHLGHHLVECDLGHPAQFLFGFGRVAEQGFDFGGAEVAGVDADDGDFSAVTASVARQSMQSGVMDCFTAFAMTATFAMTNLNVTASVARQSMTSWIASLRSQ